MFKTALFYIEGELAELEGRVNSLMNEYKLSCNGEEVFSSDIIEGIETFRGMTLVLDGITKEIYSKVYIIWYNTEDLPKDKKTKTVTLAHEIRHVVDDIMEYRRISDRETAAYMTGWISGELLV